MWKQELLYILWQVSGTREALTLNGGTVIWKRKSVFNSHFPSGRYGFPECFFQIELPKAKTKIEGGKSDDFTRNPCIWVGVSDLVLHTLPKTNSGTKYPLPTGSSLLKPVLSEPSVVISDDN